MIEFESLSEISSCVIGRRLSKSDFVPIDLSVENEELLNVDISNSNDLGAFIQMKITANQGIVGYGGYLEKRGIYKRSDYFNQPLSRDEERNIHLGMDIWVESGTSVRAVLPGTVHSFQNNTNFGDYGPTIILKHVFNSFEFFSLYGHLTAESLEGIKVGQMVESGEEIGFIGSSSVNGDYPPHLHFQLIRDIENYFGDYPGVASLKNLTFYQQNCPDPNLLLRIE